MGHCRYRGVWFFRGADPWRASVTYTVRPQVRPSHIRTDSIEVRWRRCAECLRRGNRLYASYYWRTFCHLRIGRPQLRCDPWPRSAFTRSGPKLFATRRQGRIPDSVTSPLRRDAARIPHDASASMNGPSLPAGYFINDKLGRAASALMTVIALERSRGDPCVLTHPDSSRRGARLWNQLR